MTPMTTFLIAAGIAAVCAPAVSQAQNAFGTVESVTTASTSDTDPHKLQLPNPEAYQLKDSPDYRLQGRWGKPALLPKAVPPLAKNRPPVDLPYHDKVVAAAEKSRLEPALIHAVIRIESAYNPGAVSPKGAVGLMQLMPDTARRYGVKNSRDPAENIHGGTQYLVDLKQMFDGDLNLVLAAYNAGEKAVIRYGNAVPRFPETIRYIPRVLAEYERLRRLIP